MAATPPALAELVLALHQEFRRDARGPRAVELLGAYARAHQDWRPWGTFDAQRYTRHQVERCAEFELLILCWGVGQQSPIHNHEGQNCWMAVLDGEIDELQYRWTPGSAPVLAKEARLARGEVAFIRDEIALHVVRSKPGTAGVSLHLYSRPYDECSVYCERTGAVTRKQLGYDSIRGERTAVASRA
jgi:cysteine dioxygenase